jgi:hypothetical protein
VSLHTNEKGVIDWRVVTDDFNDDAAKLKECVSLHTNEKGATDWRVVIDDFNDNAGTRTLHALQKRWGELRPGAALPLRFRKFHVTDTWRLKNASFINHITVHHRAPGVDGGLDTRVVFVMLKDDTTETRVVIEYPLCTDEQRRTKEAVKKDQLCEQGVLLRLGHL